MSKQPEPTTPAAWSNDTSVRSFGNDTRAGSQPTELADGKGSSSMLNRRSVLRLATAGVLAATGIGAGFADTPEAVAEVQATPSPRIRKVALEEHFMIPDFIPYFETTDINISADLKQRALKALADLGDDRLAILDKNGVDYSVLSLAGPGVQVEKNTAVAIKRAHQANDFLAKEIQKRPTRYGGFAHLAMQDPKAAADELERCMKTLHFQGAMINGQTNGEYLDLDKFSVFWERAAALEAPIYIHPGNPVDYPAMYAGHTELWGPVCSWAFETGAHALRLVFAGVFERYPKAKVILGHMGETLPISMWRFDSRWPICNRGGRTLPQPPSFYIRRNIAITTSGVCSNSALQCALTEMGEDNVLFSVDYPFERPEIAAKFIENIPYPEALRRKISYGNATSLMKLKA